MLGRIEDNLHEIIFARASLNLNEISHFNDIIMQSYFIKSHYNCRVKSTDK